VMPRLRSPYVNAATREAAMAVFAKLRRRDASCALQGARA
jgi:hypothetical protein